MGMVVQHNLNALKAGNRLRSNVAGLKKSSEKLSSGYRINRAGDDAAGLAISEKMRSQIRGLNQAVRNSQDGINMIQTFEGAAQESQSILQRMKELAVEAANGTYDNSTDRAAIQLEYAQLSDEIDQIAETDFNGIIMLSTEEAVSAILNAAESETGGAMKTSGTEAMTPVQAWYASEVMALADTDLADIFNYEIYINNIYNNTNDPDLTASIKMCIDESRILNDPRIAKCLRLFFEGVNSSYGIYEAETGVTGLDFYFDSAIDSVDDNVGHAQWGHYTPPDIEVGDWIISLGVDDFEVGTNGINLSKSISITIEQVNEVYGSTESGNLSVSTSSKTEIKVFEITINSSVSDLDGQLGFDLRTKISDNKAPDGDYPDYDYPGGTTHINAVSRRLNRGEAKLTFVDNIILQTGSRSNDAVNFTFDYNSIAIGDLEPDLNISASGLGLDKLALSSQESANYAIDKLDNAINKVSMIRATFGAVQNRLEHKIANLTATAENLTEAESAIRDTDMALEMMNYTKFNILQQAAQSMLAQANQQPQSILQMIGQ